MFSVKSTMLGVGFITAVAVTGGPSQPFAVGIKVKVTVTGALVVLVKVTVGIVPVPEDASPVTSVTWSLVQVKVVPPVELVGLISLSASMPEHLVCVKGRTEAIGVGLTVTVAITGVPSQPPAFAVMVNVTITGEVVVLVKVPEISPVPEAAMPVTEAVLFLVQLKVTPDVLLLSAMVVIVSSEQIDCEAGVATVFALGLIITVADPETPLEHVGLDWNLTLVRSYV